MIRTCSKCGKEKELNESNFPKKNIGRDGYDAQCKECKREYDKKRYEKNRAKISKEKAEFYRENKAEIKRRQLSYYHKNKAQCAHSERAWRKGNPIRRRMSCTKSRARIFGVEDTLTEKEWLEIKTRFKNSCAYCGMTEKEHLERYAELLHQEHIIPLIENGPNSVANVIPSCKSCNSSKRNDNFFDWYPNSKGYDEFRERKIIEYIN